MKKYFIFAILVFVFTGCSKNPSDMTLKDFRLASSEEQEKIGIEIGDTKYEILKDAIVRYKRDGIIEENGDKKLSEILEDQEKYEEELAPRREAFELATEAVRERCKNPTSLVMPTLLMEDTDSLTIEFKDNLKTGDPICVVEGTYKAKNGYGALLDGEFSVTLRKDSTGNWQPGIAYMY